MPRVVEMDVEEEAVVNAKKAIAKRKRRRNDSWGGKKRRTQKKDPGPYKEYYLAYEMRDLYSDRRASGMYEKHRCDGQDLDRLRLDLLEQACNDVAKAKSGNKNMRLAEFRKMIHENSDEIFEAFCKLARENPVEEEEKTEEKDKEDLKKEEEWLAKDDPEYLEDAMELLCGVMPLKE